MKRRLVPDIGAEQRFIAFKIIHDADESSFGSRHRTNDGGGKDAPSTSISALHCARGAYDSLPRPGPGQPTRCDSTGNVRCPDYPSRARGRIALYPAD